MANHEIVPGSAFTKGRAERRKSATSFSLPGFACNGTYSASFVIGFSCFGSVVRYLGGRSGSGPRRFRRMTDGTLTAALLRSPELQRGNAAKASPVRRYLPRSGLAPWRDGDLPVSRARSSRGR